MENENKSLEMKKDIAGFNPLIFLMSLGAGGIAIIPFSFLQYTLPHGAGLITLSQVGHGTLSFGQEILFRSLEGIMILFAIIHLILTLVLVRGLVGWIGSKSYRSMILDPLRNPGVLAPFISIIMTMNVFIGPIRFFIPWFAFNLQSFMLPALVFWSIIWVVLMKTEFELLRISFEKKFDVDKITFGWLLHSFALAMLSVTGTGIAAMSNNSGVAHVAAFMSLVCGTMGFFLFIVNFIIIFKNHFSQDGLPEKQFLPSFLIVIPNITLFAISAFRLGHYLETQHGFHLGAYFLVVITVAFAFETWYLGFGLVLLRRYFKEEFFKNEFYVTQWGLVCPLVAYAVLGGFVYKLFVQSFILYVLILSALGSVVILFFILFIRQGKCFGILKKDDILCLK